MTGMVAGAQLLEGRQPVRVVEPALQDITLDTVSKRETSGDRLASCRTFGQRCGQGEFDDATGTLANGHQAGGGQTAHHTLHRGVRDTRLRGQLVQVR